jgi:glucose-6-phosphate dehydrogenase assembly protein OpcA
VAPAEDAGGVWAAQDAKPSEIEAALSRLLVELCQKSDAYAPARVLNLVVIVDRAWRGEISNRLEAVGRYHPSRTILCSVEPGRRTIDAMAVMTTEGEPGPGRLAVCRERVQIDIGPDHLKHLDTIVDPLVVPDIATLVWAPHGHQEGVDALRGLFQVVLVDSVNEPDPLSAVKRAHDLAEHAYVVDLAWLRSTPWRERVAASFDPPQWRDELGSISAVSVRHHPESVLAGVLFLGWLASRLGWEPSALVASNGSRQGRMRSRRQEIKLRLESDPAQSVPGLVGITVETASGMSLSLDRGPGGLTARRRDRKGKESTWTLLGASRGEAGILGEGIRQALLRDPTYAPSLVAAEALLR